MSYRIKPVSSFRKQFKKLFKKYPSLKSDIRVLSDSLKDNPFQGVSIGKNCFKIRLSISSKGKGKSGGGRVITNIVVENNIVYLLAIYDKSDKENLTDKELEALLKLIHD